MDGHLRLPQIANMTGIKRHTLNARLKSNFDLSSLARTKGNQILLNSTQTRKIIQDQFLNTKGVVLYVGNLKGGVGKTTLAYILSSSVSLLGLKTCVLDLDVQANITRQYIDIPVNQPVFFDVIDGKKKVEDVILNITEQLDLIPSSLKNSLVEKTLAVQSPKHQLNWFNDICLTYLRSNYDIIIVDTPPHLTTLNSVFCLCLTNNDHIIIPVCAEEFSIMGVQMFLDDLADIRKSYDVDNDVNVSVIMNRFFQNQKTNLEMLMTMGKKYEGMLSEIIIRDNAKIREIMNNKIWANDFKKGKEIYEVILSLLQEVSILKRV